jgi:chitinase
MLRILPIAAMLATAFSANAAEPKIVGYFVEWGVYDRNYHVKNVPADQLTHLNYAFAKIVDGKCALFDRFAAVDKAYPGDKPGEGMLRGNFNQLLQLKKRHPHLKTLISVGGWTLSGPFSDVALTEQSRTRFAASCVAFIKKYGFDGVDIDWEYPVAGGAEGNKRRPEDKANFTLLLAELRKQLDAAGKTDGQTYLLSIAAPAGPRNIDNLELDKIHRHVDWINLMAYDFHGGWDKLTHFNAPLYPIKDDPARDVQSRHLNADAAVKTYLAGGVPAEKLVLGVPFYGRGWAGVPNENHGLFQTSKNVPKGTWEPGVFDYKDLAEHYVGKFSRYWQDEAKAPWLYDEKSQTMISYDNPESLRAKAAYVRGKSLGGVMCWELSGDDTKASLVRAAREGLRDK